MRRFLAPPAPPGLEPGPAPTFSVLIAAYQAAATIGEAVESALTQTVTPHEVIVVDDGSTDATQAALDPYLDRIILIRQANRGAASAVNVGMRRASGDFAAILDADDVYEAQRIEALTQLAVQRPDLDILMTDAYFEVGGEVTGRYCTSTPFAVSEQNVAIFERCFVAWPAVRRETLLRIGGFEESLRIAYDWECWIRLLNAGSLAGIVDEPLMRYRIGAGAPTGDRNHGPSLADNRVAALRDRVKILELADRLDLSADERRALHRFLPSRRRRAMMAEAEQAVREGRPEARRRSIEVALAPGMSSVERIKALAASLAPRAAARRLAEREARTGYSRIRRGAPRG